jgi:hypothetical protein
LGTAVASGEVGGETMFERVLRRFRDCVRRSDYLMTLHADEEADADGLSAFDVEAAILNGRITERQRDRATREAKYVVRGVGLDGQAVGAVVKFSLTGRMLVLTTYRD